MSKAWPMVPLGEVLSESNEWINLKAAETYREVTVKLWGKGVVQRREVIGAEIAASRRLLVRANQFILSRIDARNGAVGLVPVELDGAVVSNDFPAFNLNTGKIEPKYFEWLTKTREFVALCKAASEGTTNRVRLQEERFLSTQISLPPLSEQKRIVAKVEELAEKIEEARGLRRQAVGEADALLSSSRDAAFNLSKGWIEARVGDFCEQPQYGYTASAKAEPVGPKMLRITDIQDGKVDWDSVPFCDCHKPEQYLLQNDDIVFARTGATTGKSFLIRECPEAVFASYLIRLHVQKLVTVDYLYQYFQTPSYWAQITDTKKGTGQPNVNGKKLSNILVPIAPFEEQRRIIAHLVALHAKVDALKRLQAETSTELDAMLPSVLDKAFNRKLIK